MTSDWPTIASLATAGGTLVLAVATFASVRSANRSARVAQESLRVNMRPLLIPSRLDDPVQKIFFQEGKFFRLEGGRATVEYDDSGVVYLAMSLRNSGQGIAVIHGWRFKGGRETSHVRPPDAAEFRTQGLDLVIAPGDIGFWEAAFRDSSDPQFSEAVDAAKNSDMVTIDLRYGDHDGQQPAVSRMVLRQVYAGDPEHEPLWMTTVVRHWNLDRPDPRDR